MPPMCVWLKRVLIVIVGLVGALFLFDAITTLIARYERPRSLHRASRKLTKQLNRVHLWTVEHFNTDRNSESVIVYHKGRRSGKEYATPLCVSHCSEGFVVGDYWGPNADWFLNLKATPKARVRYKGNHYDVDAEVITIEEAHARIGGRSLCGCWEQANTKQCVLLTPTEPVIGTPPLRPPTSVTAASTDS